MWGLYAGVLQSPLLWRVEDLKDAVPFPSLPFFFFVKAPWKWDAAGQKPSGIFRITPLRN
jgi:hypothetical protein